MIYVPNNFASYLRMLSNISFSVNQPFITCGRQFWERERQKRNRGKEAKGIGKERRRRDAATGKLIFSDFFIRTNQSSTFNVFHLAKREKPQARCISMTGNLPAPSSKKSLIFKEQIISISQYPIQKHSFFPPFPPSPNPAPFLHFFTSTDHPNEQATPLLAAHLPSIYSSHNFMRKEQQLKIRTYLESPSKHPRPLQDDRLHFVYLLTYLGEMFIQGYRIIQQFGDVIILSLMEFQISEFLAPAERRATKKLPPRYVALLWQYDESNICQSASMRKTIYTKMLQVSQFFTDIEFNIIYLHTAKYSILNRVDVEKVALPTCKNYYKKIQWIQQRNGLKPLQEKDEGIQLHRLAEIFIKGAGEARDPQIIRKMQNKNKFYYDLFNVIHTICYVVGKEMLENDYQTISSEKWMRFTTLKKFKRYDLLLRNEVKSGIIDWKFSKLVAEEKIKGNGVKNKNKLYYQLAYKDFLTDVELKFYCFHARVNFNTYHFFTCASYFHKIPIEYVGDKEEVISIDGEDESIEIENDFLEMIDNQPGEDYKNEENSEIREIYSNQMAMKEPREGMGVFEKGNEVSVINIDEDQSKSTDKENKDMRMGKEEKEVEQVQEVKQPSEKSKKMWKSQIKVAKFQEKFIDLT